MILIIPLELIALEVSRVLRDLYSAFLPSKQAICCIKQLLFQEIRPFNRYGLVLLRLEHNNRC